MHGFGSDPNGIRPTTLREHGFDVIAIEDSRELLRRSGLQETQLVTVGECHKMTDKKAFETLFDAVERAAQG